MQIAPRPLTVWDKLWLNPVTISLLLACVGVAVWTQLGANLTAVRWLTFVDLAPGSSAEGLFPGWAQGQWWRAVTPIFIHFGVIHLVFNLMWLYDLGKTIETRWGARHLLGLVMACGVLANIAQYCLNWDFKNGFSHWNALSGGMSGVVYGLFGYLGIRARREPAAGLQLDQQTTVLMLGWLVFCMTGMMGHIGNTAHLVGLLVGVAAACVPLSGRPRIARD